MAPRGLLRFLLLIASVVLLVAACGSDPEAEDATSITSPSASEDDDGSATTIVGSAPSTQPNETSTTIGNEPSTTSTVSSTEAMDFNREEFGPSPFFEDPCWLVDRTQIEQIYGSALPELAYTPNPNGTFGICHLLENEITLANQNDDVGVKVWVLGREEDEAYIQDRIESFEDDALDPSSRPDIGDGGFSVTNDRVGSVQFLKDGMFFIATVLNEAMEPDERVRMAEEVANLIIAELPTRYTQLQELNPVSEGACDSIDTSSVEGALGSSLNRSPDESYLQSRCRIDANDGSVQVSVNVWRPYADQSTLERRALLQDAEHDGESFVSVFENGAGAGGGFLASDTYLEVIVFAPDKAPDEQRAAVIDVGSIALESLGLR